MSQRILYMDAAKGFAIFSVILNHCNNIIFRWDNILLGNIIASYYMAVFFLISGYFTYKPNCQISQCIIKKTKYLLVPLLTVCVVINLFKCWFFNNSFLEDTIIGTMKGGYWFLFVLYGFNLLYLLIIYISRRLEKNINQVQSFIYLCIVLYLILFTLTYFVRDTMVYNILSLPNFRRYFPIFILGVLIKMFERKFNIWNNATTLICGVMYVVFMILYLQSSEKNILNLVLWSVCAVFGSIFIINLFRLLPLRRMTLWGKYTLSIYIYHYIILYILKVHTPPLLISQLNENQLIALSAYSIISILTIELIILIVSKIKQNKYSYIFGL